MLLFALIYLRLATLWGKALSVKHWVLALNFSKVYFPLNFINKVCLKRANCLVVIRNKICLF